MMGSWIMLRMRLLPVVLVAFVLMGLRIAEGQSSAQRVDPVARLVARYDSAWNSKDTAGVGRLMAPEYQYFTSLGEVLPRAEMLRFLGSPEYTLQQSTRSELVVTRSGSAAVVSSRWRGWGTYKGKSFIDDQRCGLVWVQTAGTWQLLSEHCVQIAPKTQ